MFRHFVLFLLLFSCLLSAMKTAAPKPQIPGRDYNIEYRIEWAWEKPQVTYEWFWMPDGAYPER